MGAGGDVRPSVGEARIGADEVEERAGIEPAQVRDPKLVARGDRADAGLRLGLEASDLRLELMEERAALRIRKGEPAIEVGLMAARVVAFEERGGALDIRLSARGRTRSQP